MRVQFDVLLRWGPLQKEDEGHHAEDDSKKHSELIHVGEKHGPPLHGIVEACHRGVAMIGEAGLSGHPAEVLPHTGLEAVMCWPSLLMDLRVSLKHRAHERNTKAATLISHERIKAGRLRTLGLGNEAEDDSNDRGHHEE